MENRQHSKYQTIADYLRSKILEGTYEIDDLIPSENQLQKQFEVSRHTVREAISVLVNEGYLRKEKGSGTYVSNVYANDSKAAPKKVIGVITTYLSDYIFPSIIRGIEQELSLLGYSLLLSSTNNDVTQEKKSLEMMLEKGVDGLIIEPTKSNQFNPNLSYYLSFQERGIPYIMINACYEELSVPYIGLDDTEAGYLATKHLLDYGHREIGLITKIDDIQGKNRMSGYIKAYSEQKLVYNSKQVITFETESVEQIFTEVRNLQENKKLPTAFVCYNDSIALQVIELLNLLGLNVPEDISIVSHDDSFLSTATTIKLTSVIHPKEKLGKDAANWIITQIEKSGVAKKSIIYKPKLIIRNSSKRL